MNIFIWFIVNCFIHKKEKKTNWYFQDCRGSFSFLFFIITQIYKLCYLWQQIKWRKMCFCFCWFLMTCCFVKLLHNKTSFIDATFERRIKEKLNWKSNQTDCEKGDNFNVKIIEIIPDTPFWSWCLTFNLIVLKDEYQRDMTK